MINIIIHYMPMALLIVCVIATSYAYCHHTDLEDDPRNHANDPFLCPYGQDHMNPFWTDGSDQL